MLPKETIDRINTDAQDWKKGAQIYISPAHLHGYHAGATTEKERSQKLVEALEDIAKTVLLSHEMMGNNPTANICRNKAIEAIAKHHP
jgi:hypothetical protein